MEKFSGKCPACGSAMEVLEYVCPNCSTAVRGRFGAAGFGELSARQAEFVKVFLRCRGNIKEVERELGISYPTVRSRLDDVVRALGLTPASDREALQERADVLDRLERGEIDADTAAKMLQKRGRK